ncbi:hypothetical protein L7F22_042896 [Adiantum nelumboides]|nr:hypothetical protein [Adiantum nelumboides]
MGFPVGTLTDQGSCATQFVDVYSYQDQCTLHLCTLSCFCDPCLSGKWRRCKNRQYIEEWKYVSIVPVQEVDSEDSEEEEGAKEDDNNMTTIAMSRDNNLLMYESNPQTLSAMLSIGDNFATMATKATTWIACKQWHSKGWVFLASHEVLMQEPWGGAHSLLCLSIGVFSYDAFDLLLSSIYIHRPLTLLHHAILVIGFSTALLINHGFNYLVLTLICELHSIFAHLRRLLRMLGLHQDGSLLVKGEWSLHWVAYFTTRLSLHLLISIKLFLNWSKFSFAIERPMVLASILGINSLNVALGFELYKVLKIAIRL